MFECVWDMDSKNGYFKNLTCPMTFLDDLVFLSHESNVEQVWPQ